MILWESGGVAMPTNSPETDRVLREDLQTALDEGNVPEVGDPEEEEDEEEDEDEQETGEDSGWSD
jgi:hypothetical protein